jgi:hypothetical protein
VTSASSPSGHLRTRGRNAGDKKELSWLMRTTYITNDAYPVTTFFLPICLIELHVGLKPCRCCFYLVYVRS